MDSYSFKLKAISMMLVTILTFWWQVWWQICHQYLTDSKDFCSPQEIMLPVVHCVFEIFLDQLDYHLYFYLLDIFSKLESNQFDVFHRRNNHLDEMMFFFFVFLNLGCPKFRDSKLSNWKMIFDLGYPKVWFSLFRKRIMNLNFNFCFRLNQLEQVSF